MSLLEDDLINLEQFEIQYKIEKSIPYKFYQISNINNGRKSTAKVSSYNINSFDREELIIFSREVSIMSRINFPSITKLTGYNLKNFKNKPKPTIIMDFTLKHTLYKLLSDDELELNDTQKLINLYGIASAISYLHSHDIIHGNLSTSSVYLDENFYTKIDKKLKDFSFNGSNIDLSKYILFRYDSEFYPKGIDCLIMKNEKHIKLEEKIQLYFKQHKTDKQFYAQICPKEINDFYQHEIINFSRKLSILSQINHPAIMKFIGYSPIDFNNKNRPIIITEFCSSKIDFIFQFNDSTEELSCFYGIASAMAYLHKHGIIHRNLIPTNVYFGDNDLPKLYGFEIAKRIDDEMDSEKNKIKGTPAYLAPEIFMKQEYSKASDVYSFGLFMYKFVQGSEPFSDFSDPSNLKHAICDEGKRPEFYFFSVYNNLIERCWSQNPKDRPTFEEILEELKTNPEFITLDIDKNRYYDYIKFIDEYKATFDESKRIKDFDESISSKLQTFKSLEAYPGLTDMHKTETNDLSFDYNSFDLSNFDKINNKRLRFYEINIYTNKSQKTEKLMQICSFENVGSEFSRKCVFKMKIISQFNHPCILKYIGCNQLDLICEYLPNGTTYDFLNKNTQFFVDMTLDLEWNETKKLIYFYGIASGMSYLHSHDIIHRDLKPESILLDKQLHPRISNFLIAKKINNKTILKSRKIKGTPAYLAPEVYLNCEYSKSSDVYSFGLIMYEILTGKKPFENINSPKGIKKAICDERVRPSIPENISEPYRNLIERCWSQDTKLRPSFEEIVNELKTNSSFITNEIEEKEYRSYIQQIDESLISFNPQKELKVIEHDFENKDKTEILPKVNRYGIYQTELDNILLDYDYVDIHKYKKEALIYKNKSYETYKISDKQTGTIYQAKKSGNSIGLNFYLEANHPTLLKFIGYSPGNFKSTDGPMIITEFGINGSLESILEVDMNKTNEMILDPTKRLIILYGIASGMSYIHSHNVIHGRLDTSAIVLDEFLFPRITEFNYSSLLSENPIPNPENMFIYGFYGDSIYASPEYVFAFTRCSANDVYAFSFIAYQLITNEKLFNGTELDFNFLKKMHEQSIRPDFKENVPECYRKLIEMCWAIDPRDRPTFDEIVYLLRTNPEFITESIDKKEYESYIKLLDEFQTNVNFIQAEDFLKMKTTTFRKVKIDFNKIKNPTRLILTVGMGSINLNKYEKLQKIGSGSFGNVYKVINRETQDLYALKTSIYEIDQCNNDIIVNLSREIDIISKLNHPSILKFIGFNPRNFKNKPKPIIITELAQNISLDKIIEQARNSIGNYDWDDTKKLINIYGIAAGMAYIHHLDIIHRDLKPANILLDEFLYPKIADFGLSKYIYNEYEIDINGNKPITSGFKGTYAYSPPETFNQYIYSKAGDVYAFGMIVYEIMTNEILFKEFNSYNLGLAIVRGYRPKFNFAIPYCYRKLIEKCWSGNYSNRPKFSKIVKLLETDPSFITPNVDKEEYYNYISLVKESSSYNLPCNLNGSNSNSNAKNSNSNKISSSNLKIVENEESNERTDCFLDLTKFKRNEIICKNNSSKMYKFIEIETGKLYTGQMSMFKINKISKSDIDKLSNELNIISKLNHPCLLKFIGYSPIDFKKQQKPVIVSEYFSNGSLSSLLEIDRIKKPIFGWNDTKKLIILFGIASGMSYLHSHGIIHKSLCPSNIYLDDILTPKIGDFGLSTKYDSSENITVQSISGVKVASRYSAPEVLLNNEYSKSSDVYSFGLIAYEILCNEVPFNQIEDNNKMYKEVVINQSRPKIKENLPKSYQKFIESCWSQSPNERPTFNEIVYQMKTDNEFITDSINADDYVKYIKFIDDQFEPITRQKINEPKEENETRSKNKSYNDEAINKLELNNEEEKTNENGSNEEEKINEDRINEEEKTNEDRTNEEEKINENRTNEEEKINEDRINEEEKNDEDGINEEEKINEDRINEEEKNDEDGINEEEKINVELLEDLAIKYIRENDTENIYKFLNILIQIGSMNIALEYAVNLYKQKYYQQSFSYFSILSKFNHPIAKYYIGVMKFRGEGCEKNRQEAYEILKYLSDRGIDKSTEFLDDHFPKNT